MRTPVPKRSGLGFNMTPMIDVVFLLIIFFLVASHFSQQEKSVDVELPQASTGEAMVDDEMQRLTLSIPEAGRIFLGSRELKNAEKEVEVLLETEKQRVPEGFQLRIRAGRRVPFQSVQPILLTAAKCGIYDIQFAVMKP